MEGGKEAREEEKEVGSGKRREGREGGGEGF